MAPGTLRTISVHCHKNGRPWSRLHIHYPQWPVDPVGRPPYDTETARQILALTGELPGSKRGLEIVLAEHRRALGDLISAAEHRLLKPSPKDAPRFTILQDHEGRSAARSGRKQQAAVDHGAAA